MSFINSLNIRSLSAKRISQKLIYIGILTVVFSSALAVKAEAQMFGYDYKSNVPVTTNSRSPMYDAGYSVYDDQNTAGSPYALKDPEGVCGFSKDTGNEWVLLTSTTFSNGGTSTIFDSSLKLEKTGYRKDSKGNNILCIYRTEDTASKQTETYIHKMKEKCEKEITGEFKAVSSSDWGWFIDTYIQCIKKTRTFQMK